MLDVCEAGGEAWLSFTSCGIKHPACAKPAARLFFPPRGEAALLPNRKSGNSQNLDLQIESPRDII